MRNVEWIEKVIKTGPKTGQYQMDMMLPIADSRINMYVQYSAQEPTEALAAITIARYKTSERFTVMQYDNPLSSAMDTLEMVMQRFRRNYDQVTNENAIELKDILAGLLYECKELGSFGPKPWNSTVWWVKDAVGVAR